MKTVERPSPNHDSRPAGRPVDILVLHYTGMATADEALARLCDPTAKVSAHYTVAEDGTVYAHVPERRRAWHAGVASWGGDSDVNGRSVGIEVVNPGHEFGYRPFPAAQMAALAELAQAVLARHPIPPHRVVGHSDVAPARKRDPGELFDWPGLATAGIGLWPELPSSSPPLSPPGVLRPGDRGAAVEALRRGLAAFGYGLPVDAGYDRATEQVMIAFQRHFRPARFDGIADGETRAILDWLLARTGYRIG